MGSSLATFATGEGQAGEVNGCAMMTGSEYCKELVTAYDPISSPGQSVERCEE